MGREGEAVWEELPGTQGTTKLPPPPLPWMGPVTFSWDRPYTACIALEGDVTPQFFILYLPPATTGPVPYFISATWILVSATSHSPQPIAPTRRAIWPQITFFWCTVGHGHRQSTAATLAKAAALPVQTLPVPCSEGVAAPVTASSTLQGGPALLALKASMLSKHQCINSQKK